MNFGSSGKDMDKSIAQGDNQKKAWKDIWGSGQGIGSIKDNPTVKDLVNELTKQYDEAYKEMQDKKIG